eukprot:scaffold38071_cov107-Isochrysis_galbana.AAC.2
MHPAAPRIRCQFDHGGVEHHHQLRLCQPVKADQHRSQSFVGEGHVALVGRRVHPRGCAARLRRHRPATRPDPAALLCLRELSKPGLERYNLSAELLNLPSGAAVAPAERRRRQLLPLAQSEEGMGRVDEKLAQLIQN